MTPGSFAPKRAPLLAWLPLLPLLLLTACASMVKPTPPPRDAVVEAEHAFARTVAERGVRDAFASAAAENAVLFRPQPVPALPALRAQAPDRQRLQWAPERVIAAAGGDLAVSIGPYVFAQAANAPIVGNGHFLNVWTRSGEREWRYALVAGIVHPPYADQEARSRDAHALADWQAPTGRCAADALQAAESALLGERRGGEPLPWAAIAPDVMMLRQNAQPTSARIFERPWADAAVARGAPLVASSADLAVFHGSARLARDAPVFGFVHVWSCETDTWRLKVDFSNARS